MPRPSCPACNTERVFSASFEPDGGDAHGFAWCMGAAYALVLVRQAAGRVALMPLCPAHTREIIGLLEQGTGEKVQPYPGAERRPTDLDS